jgi:hypothetical protein
LLLRSQEGAKREASHWQQDLPIYKNWLRLKYPSGHPLNPDTIAQGGRCVEEEEVIEPVESAYPPV